MCGIAGFAGEGTLDTALSLAKRMSGELRHRGPDDYGETAISCGNMSVGFAHRRLSIIELSAAGRQPMGLDDGRLWINFNGEIFNYLELRKELEGLGRTFRTRTDTEVLLQAYDQWGEACLLRLNGMWAFALCDRARQLVFCSVDHAGIKPFYFASTSAGTAFASEIKALAALPTLDRTADEQRLALYLLSGICQVDEQTMFSGVKQLMPGHAMVLRPGKAPRIWKWWKPRVLLSPPSFEDAAAEFRAVLRDAIKLRFRSDVAVGIAQSAGVDSCGITCVTADLQRTGELTLAKKVKTFTATVDDADLDEGAGAREISAFGGAEWHGVRPSMDGLLMDMEALVRQQDEPFSGLSTYMQYCVMRLAREHGVVVLLGGQGPDELFSGYPWHYGSAWKDMALKRGIIATLKSVADSLSHGMIPGRSLLAYLAYEFLPLVRKKRYQARVTRLGGTARLKSESDERFGRVFSDTDPDQQFRNEVEACGLPSLMRYEDRNSMAFAVESRPPYLDPRFFDLAYSVPQWMKIEKGWSKAIPRRALERYMPHDVVWKRRKIGFSPPGANFFEATRKIGLDVLGMPNSRTRGLVDSCVIRGQLERRIADPQVCWRFLNAELWMRAFGLSVT
jgi:asparagine synthase (glutamine-hydrolysing)